jgi:hypothetical protein
MDHDLYTTMTTRTPIAAADLFVLLDREFQRRKPRECDTCFVSLPFRVDVRGTDAPNWETLVPLGCGQRCDAVLEEIVAQLQAIYDLAPAD